MAKIPTATQQGRQAGRGGGQFIQQGGTQVPRGSDIDTGLDQALESVQRMVVLTGQANNEEKENEAVTKIKELSAQVAQDILELDPTEQAKAYEDGMKSGMSAIREEFNYNPVVWSGAETRTTDFRMSSAASIATGAAKTQSERTKASLELLHQGSVMDVASTMANPHFDHSNVSVLANHYNYISIMANDIMEAHVKSASTIYSGGEAEAVTIASKKIGELYKSAIELQVQKDTQASAAIVQNLLGSPDIAGYLGSVGALDDLKKDHAAQVQRVEEQGKMDMQINLQATIDDIGSAKLEDLPQLLANVRGMAFHTKATVKETQVYMNNAFKNIIMSKNFTSEKELDETMEVLAGAEAFRGMKIDKDAVRTSYLSTAENEAKEKKDTLSDALIKLYSLNVPFDGQYVTDTETSLAENYLVEGEQVSDLLTPLIDTLTADLTNRQNQAYLGAVLDYLQNDRKIDNKKISAARKSLVDSFPELDQSEARVDAKLNWWASDPAERGDEPDFLVGDTKTLSDRIKENPEPWLETGALWEFAKDVQIIPYHVEHIGMLYDRSDYAGIMDAFDQMGTPASSEVAGLNRQFILDSPKEMVLDSLIYMDDSMRGSFIEVLQKSPQAEEAIFGAYKNIVDIASGVVDEDFIDEGTAVLKNINRVLYGSDMGGRVLSNAEIQEYATSIAWRAMEAVSPGGDFSRAPAGLGAEFFDAVNAGLENFAQDFNSSKVMLNTHGGLSRQLLTRNLNNLHFAALMEDVSKAYPLVPDMGLGGTLLAAQVPLIALGSNRIPVTSSMIETSINKLESITRSEISADTNHAFFSQPSDNRKAVGVVNELVIPFRTKTQEIGFIAMEFMNDGTMRPMEIGDVQDGIVSTAYSQRIVGEDEFFVANKESLYSSAMAINSRLANTRVKAGFTNQDTVDLAISMWSERNDGLTPTEDDFDSVFELYNQIVQARQSQ